MAEDTERDETDAPMFWLDRQLIRTHMWAVAGLAFCASGLALILGLIGYRYCREPEARRKLVPLTYWRSGGLIAAINRFYFN